MQDTGYSVLITGGGSGLGAGIARYMAGNGARVTISGRRSEKLQEVAEEIGPTCAVASGDICDEDDRARMIDVAVSHGGGLQGLVNAAGNMLNGPIDTLEGDAILDLLNTNVVAGMALTGLAVPHLERDGGAVLFIGSVHTRRAYPGASPYAASNSAVEALCRVLAAELGPKGIRVNCLLPGAVPAEINVRAGIAASFEHNLERLRSMEEAADYLLRAQWTTGTSIVIDGGLSLGVSYK